MGSGDTAHFLPTCRADLVYEDFFVYIENLGKWRFPIASHTHTETPRERKLRLIERSKSRTRLRDSDEFTGEDADAERHLAESATALWAWQSTAFVGAD